MKKLFMLLVLVGMAGAAGYIYWEKQAKLIDVRIAEAVQQFNAEVKAQSGITAIEYESLKISGFPYSITLTLKNPVLRLPLSQWIRESNPAQRWIEEHRFKGDLSLSADWKVTKYTLRLPQERESLTYINGNPAFARKSVTAEAPSCSLSLDLMESFEHLWQPQEMLESLRQDASLLKALECDVRGYQAQLTDASGGPIQKADSISFELHIDKSKEKNALDSWLDIDVRKFQAYPASDAYFTALLQAFPALISYTRYQELGINALAFLGEQNLSVEAKYTGDAVWPDWSHQAKIEIPKFQLDNGLGNYNGKLQLHNQPVEGGTKRAITFEAQMHAKLATLLERLLQRRFAVYLSSGPTMIGYNLFFIDTAQLPRAEMPAMAAELYPQLNALSPFDIEAKGKLMVIPPRDAGGLPQQANLQIENILISNPFWKAGLQGQVDYNPMLLLPTLDAMLSIQNGDEVFKQFMGKLVVMEKWRQRQADRPAVILTDELMKDLHRMIESIANGQQENLSAETTSFGNPKFHLEFKNFMPRVNGLDINQIMLLFNELLSTHLTATRPESYVPPPAQYQPR